MPLRKLFSYSFGDCGAAGLVPGVRVVVPFGNRDVAGVFLGFAESDIETKEIKAVLDESSLFPPALVELALWCADYYMSAPGEIFRMICPRESLKKKIVFRKTGKATGKVGAGKKAILDLVDEEFSSAVLAKKAGLTARELDKEAKALIRGGYLEKKEEFYFTQSRMQPLEWLSPNSSPETPILETGYTDEQKNVIEEISEEMVRRKGRVTLLQGVTGSGKTEVYIALCKRAVASGGGAIVLVPEIALTYQFVRRFYSCFGRAIAVLHSGLTPAQRREEWTRIGKGDAQIVIGARSAIFAPMRDIRLVVVDEEHDGSYKQGEYPYYNARDLAVVLGRITGAAVLLGSATPSLETYHNAQNGKYSHSRLVHRIDRRPMPNVKMVEDDEKSDALFPAGVVEKLAQRIRKGEQSLVFINRRGASTCVKCRVCREVAQCPNCSVSLTFHSNGAKMLCHYCGFESPIPEKCDKCGANGLFSYRGVGTQKVESQLAELLPKARIERLDQDTAPTREKAFAILERFENRQTDILVGTQMTAKGHDFENLTFTAIVGADDYLAFPDFRSAERTFSLVTQAAGRTGRGVKGGEVVISGKGDHYAIRCAVGHDYDAFFKEEIKVRKATSFPPFSRLVGILFDSNSQEKLEKAMLELSAAMPKMPSGVTVMGPVPALIYRVRNRYRWKLLLKGTNSRALHMAAILVESAVDGNIAVSIDVDPIGFY